MLVFTWKHVHTHLLRNGGVRHFALLHTTVFINSLIDNDIVLLEIGMYILQDSYVRY